MENTETEAAAESPVDEAAGTVRADRPSAAKTLSTPATGKPKKPLKQKEHPYQAEYLGSGTFRISKPKRRGQKRRQSALKNRRRGSRK